jgi:hypothetical protein
VQYEEVKPTDLLHNLQPCRSHSSPPIITYQQKRHASNRVREEQSAPHLQLILPFEDSRGNEDIHVKLTMTFFLAPKMIREPESILAQINPQEASKIVLPLYSLATQSLEDTSESWSSKLRNSWRWRNNHTSQSGNLHSQKKTNYGLCPTTLFSRPF